MIADLISVGVASGYSDQSRAIDSGYERCGCASSSRPDDAVPGTEAHNSIAGRADAPPSDGPAEIRQLHRSSSTVASDNGNDRRMPSYRRSPESALVSRSGNDQHSAGSSVVECGIQLTLRASGGVTERGAYIDHARSRIYDFNNGRRQVSRCRGWEVSVVSVSIGKNRTNQQRAVWTYRRSWGAPLRGKNAGYKSPVRARIAGRPQTPDWRAITNFPNVLARQITMMNIHRAVQQADRYVGPPGCTLHQITEVDELQGIHERMVASWAGELVSAPHRVLRGNLFVTDTLWYGSRNKSEAESTRSLTVSVVAL